MATSTITTETETLPLKLTLAYDKEAHEQVGRLTLAPAFF